MAHGGNVSTEPGLTTGTSRRQGSLPLAFGSGVAIGILGGMIGLGGAEFRLPLLISVFGFVALQSVILNKAMSLVVVAVALPARLLGVPLAEVLPYWPIVVNLLVGSLIVQVGLSRCARPSTGSHNQTCRTRSRCRRTGPRAHRSPGGGAVCLRAAPR